tara:strand:+ start:302 stop:625 length:324 start_codon:yes stop_codon:yes gene_type:complete
MTKAKVEVVSYYLLPKHIKSMQTLGSKFDGGTIVNVQLVDKLFAKTDVVARITTDTIVQIIQSADPKLLLTVSKRRAYWYIEVDDLNLDTPTMKKHKQKMLKSLGWA